MFGEHRRGEGRTKVFSEIVATNGISVRKGHTLLTQLVVSGEVPLALTVYNYKAEQLKARGRADRLVHDRQRDRAPQRRRRGAQGAASARGRALLRLRAERGRAADSSPTRDFVPTSRKVDTPLNKVPMTFVDARVSIDEYDKWKNLYDELFGAGAR